MEDFLYAALSPMFNVFMWLIIEPEARPWLYATWAGSIVICAGMLWSLGSEDD